MYCYRLIILFLIGFIFLSCENDNNIDDEELSTDFYFNNVAAFYNHYDIEFNRLSVYLEFLDEIEDIVSISGSIEENGSQIFEFNLDQSDINSKVFIFEGELLDYYSNPILSDTIFLYNMIINIQFEDDIYYEFSSDLTTPIAPELINYNIPNSFELDSINWKILTIDLVVKDLNGFSNIDLVKYEIKTTLLNGCENECVIDENCNQDIIGEDYISDDTWALDYNISNTDTTFSYTKEILIRPIDGSALYDEDGNIIFNETDCGKTGIIEFKLIVIDKDGMNDMIEGILMEIIK